MLEPARQRGDDLFFASTQLINVDGRFAKVDAPVAAQLVNFGDDSGNVQQRFGRDAASQQARSAQAFFRFDQRYIDAFVGSQKGGRVAAGATTKYRKLSVHFRRVSSEWFE